MKLSGEDGGFSTYTLVTLGMFFLRTKRFPMPDFNAAAAAFPPAAPQRAATATFDMGELLQQFCAWIAHTDFEGMSVSLQQVRPLCMNHSPKQHHFTSRA